MLGLPPGDVPQLKKWSDDFSAIFSDHPSELSAATYQLAQRSTQDIKNYFRTQLAQQATQQRPNLLTALAQVDAEGDRLTEDELLSNANLLLEAGHETTTNLIGNGLLALFRHPEQFQRLKEDPALLPTAIEEFLRFDSPVQFMNRMAQEDLDLGGKAIRQGQLVYLMFRAPPNRDGTHFPDPDIFDIGRTPNKHLSFGQGPHFCLGAALARLEARIVFETLLRRCPAIRLDNDIMVPIKTILSFRAVYALPVRW